MEVQIRVIVHVVIRKRISHYRTSYTTLVGMRTERWSLVCWDDMDLSSCCSLVLVLVLVTYQIEMWQRIEATREKADEFMHACLPEVLHEAFRHLHYLAHRREALCHGNGIHGSLNREIEGGCWQMIWLDAISSYTVRQSSRPREGSFSYRSVFIL